MAIENNDLENNITEEEDRLGIRFRVLEGKEAEKEYPLCIPRKIFKRPGEEGYRDLSLPIKDQPSFTKDSPNEFDPKKVNSNESFNNVISPSSPKDNAIDFLYSFQGNNSFSSSFSLSDLNDYVRKFNLGHEKLEKLVLKDNSNLYFYSSAIVEGIKKLFGYNLPIEQTFNELFMEQYDNVSSMNSYLVKIIKHYEPELMKYHDELKELVDKALFHHRCKEDYKEKAPQIIERYQGLNNHLLNIDRSKEPEKYYSGLLDHEKEKDILIRMRSNCLLSDISSLHYDKEIDKMIHIHEIDSNLFLCVKTIAAKTKLYQESLFKTFKDLQRIKDLSVSVKALTEGVVSLSSYHRQINDIYINSANSIVQFQKLNPSGKMNDESLSQLASLSSQISRNMSDNTRLYLDK